MGCCGSKIKKHTPKKHTPKKVKTSAASKVATAKAHKAAIKKTGKCPGGCHKKNPYANGTPGGNPYAAGNPNIGAPGHGPQTIAQWLNSGTSH